MATPLLANTRTWYIDTIDTPDGATLQTRPLAEHIWRLFETLLPNKAQQSYDLRLACRYAFALTVDQDSGEDLLSALPVLLGPRFTIAAGVELREATAVFRASLVDAIGAWKAQHKPLQTKGMFIFSVSLFSNVGAANGGGANLPLLRIDDLRLRLEYISELA